MPVRLHGPEQVPAPQCGGAVLKFVCRVCIEPDTCVSKTYSVACLQRQGGKHGGLLGMRERAERLGACLCLLSRVALETEAELRAPIVWRSSRPDRRAKAPALQIDQMARHRLAANADTQPLLNIAIRLRHTLVLAQVFVP